MPAVRVSLAAEDHERACAVPSLPQPKLGQAQAEDEMTASEEVGFILISITIFVCVFLVFLYGPEAAYQIAYGHPVPEPCDDTYLLAANCSQVINCSAVCDEQQRNSETFDCRAKVSPYLVTCINERRKDG